MANLKSLLTNKFIELTNSRIREIRRKKLTYLPQGALYNIYKGIQRIEEKNIPGALIETGCALGGSTILIGMSKLKSRKLNVYDVFGMIPPPTNEDGEDVQNRYEKIKDGESSGIKDDVYYGYENDLLTKVKNNLNEFGLSENDNIELIQGLYEDTLKVDFPVAFAHIDCDWYDSVMTSLKQIVPNLSKGGIIIIDDYYIWSGCKKAVDEYFDEGNKRKSFGFDTKNEKLIITRK